MKGQNNDLIEPGIMGLTRRLNLTYPEAEDLMKKIHQLPVEKQTWETMQQLAEEMRHGKSQPQNNQ